MCCVPPSKLIGEGTEPHSAAHKLIKGDSAVQTVALHDAVHSLRAQTVTHGVDGLLQLMALYCPTLVPVKGCEGPPPAIQSLPQVLELIKAHSAGQIPVQHIDHQSACLKAKGLV